MKKVSNTINKTLFFLGWWLVVTVVACDESGGLSYRSLDECKQVAELKKTGDHEVVACRAELIKDTVVLPLSYLTEELQIVKLENKPEAYALHGSQVIIGEQYIIIVVIHL